MASHELGKSVCLPATPLHPTAATSPLPPFFHLTTQPVYSVLHLVAQPCLSRFQQVSLSRAGRGGVMCVPASHLQTWSPQNAPPEYVLLEGFCPFPVWMGENAARQNGLLSAKRATQATGLEHLINVYTFDCQMGVMERIEHLFELPAKKNT